jgi:hypothetical protein
MLGVSLTPSNSATNPEYSRIMSVFFCIRKRFKSADPPLAERVGLIHIYIHTYIHTHLSYIDLCIHATYNNGKSSFTSLALFTLLTSLTSLTSLSSLILLTSLTSLTSLTELVLT